MLIGAYLEVVTQALGTTTTNWVAGSTQIGWTNSFGHALVEESQFKIGGVEMDKIYSEWYEIWSEFYIPEAQRASYDEMVGKYPGDTIATLDGNGTYSNNYIIPFRYWFEKPGIGVPTAALEGIDIEITVRFRQAIGMLVSDVGSGTLVGNAPTFTARVWVDFAFVGDDERDFLVLKAQTYLIQQLMRTTSDSITFNSDQEVNFQLHFNLPATDMFFIVQHDTDVTNNTGTNRWFKYGAGTGASETDWFSTALLKLNNANREETRANIFFRNYRPFKAHTSSPRAFIYEFPFALFPEAFQPSGSMNFSKLDQATLVLKKIDAATGTSAFFDNAAINAIYGGGTGVSRAYIRKYNTFTVTGGTAGVGFSS